MAVPATRLSASSFPESDPGMPAPGSDLNAFHSPRRSLWGSGTAARIEVPAPWPENLNLVSETLAAIDHSNGTGPAGSGPVAFGALPFERDTSAVFTVPQQIHGSGPEGERWLTIVSADGAASTTGIDAGGTTTGPDITPIDHDRVTTIAEPRTLTVRSVIDPEQWCRSVDEARSRMTDGELTKVVLSREIVVEADRAFDPTILFNRLRRAYPASMCFAIDGFIGASPELLVSRIGDVVRAHPMAGTTQRSGDPAVDQQRANDLLMSSKNRTEHQITIDMVHDTLLPWCSYLDAEPSPSVVPAGPVQHLATMVEGRLSRPAPSVLDLVAALHPTPAVGGWPVAPAISTVEALEPAPRGRYAGPVGWVDASGNGAFAVAVRSAQISGPVARLFAGVGIVADSDPLSELEETRIKARALLDVLVRV